MKKLFLTLFLLFLSTLSVPIDLDELRTLWSSWKTYYGKSYSFAEESARFAIFIENYRRIIDFNSNHATVKQGLNKFADITSEEFKQFYSLCHLPQSKTQGLLKPTPIDDNPQVGIPSSVDWRQQGAVGPVENQGNCGACWAIAAVGALQSLYYIDTGHLVLLSEQQLVDCVQDSQGCAGGRISSALAYTATYGLETEEEYPYTASDEDCRYNETQAIRVSSGFQWVEFNDVLALKTAIVKQPVPVMVEADQDVFQFYASGVISDGCGAETDHGVLAVGYETVDGLDSYIVQNTWGDDWGMDGYVYISTDGDANNGGGVCGILTGPVVPLR